MHLLVFQTNVMSPEEVNDIAPHLDRVEGILRWDVEIAEDEGLLRVETPYLTVCEVEHILWGLGYMCMEQALATANEP